jgi:hypothetical protein
LWRDLRPFQRDGLLGLIDRRTLPHVRGKPAVQDLLPRPIQQHIVRLAIAHPFTARELARIVRDGYRYPVDHRGIQRVLAQHHLSPEVLLVCPRTFYTDVNDLFCKTNLAVHET